MVTKLATESLSGRSVGSIPMLSKSSALSSGFKLLRNVFLRMLKAVLTTF